MTESHAGEWMIVLLVALVALWTIYVLWRR